MAVNNKVLRISYDGSLVVGTVVQTDRKTRDAFTARKVKIRAVTFNAKLSPEQLIIEYHISGRDDHMEEAYLSMRALLRGAPTATVEMG